MCAFIGCEVLRLKRVAVGNIKLDGLKKEEYRFLREDEIKYLKGL
jgi:16S rRNA U516 pseudouridylate synthase RsuA-like enzyme